MPYIPEDHRIYDLLPACRRRGGEVFSLPTDLRDQLNELLDSDTQLLPYDFSSYEEYYEELARLRKVYSSRPEIVKLLHRFEKEMRRRNKKEEWSVMRYLGPTGAIPDLTPGRCYYWPSSKETPVYEGVIDDEEFTSYLYPTHKDWWFIVTDPTGMAKKALHGFGAGFTVAEYADATDQPQWFREAFDPEYGK